MVEIILLTYLSLVVAKSFSPIVVCFILIEVLKAEICSLRGATLHVIKSHLKSFLYYRWSRFLKGHFWLGQVKGEKLCNHLGTICLFSQL